MSHRVGVVRTSVTSLRLFCRRISTARRDNRLHNEVEIGRRVLVGMVVLF